MPRPLTILTDNYPYHVTIRTNNSQFFSLNMEQCWDIFKNELITTQRKYNFEIHGFVLMTNHYHLVVSTPNKNLSKGLVFFHSQVSKKFGLLQNTKNHLFGDRYKWSLITSDPYYYNTLRYIYQNPVRAGIVRKVENYKFSTLYESQNKSNKKLLISSRIEDFKPENKDLLGWLNQPVSI